VVLKTAFLWLLENGLFTLSIAWNICRRFGVDGRDVVLTGVIAGDEGALRAILLLTEI